MVEIHNPRKPRHYVERASLQVHEGCGTPPGGVVCDAEGRVHYTSKPSRVTCPACCDWIARQRLELQDARRNEGAR